MFGLHFCVFALFLIVRIYAKSTIRLCVVGNPAITNRVTKYCDALAKSKNTPVSCYFESDRLECLWSISRHKADMAILEPEDVYFSTVLEETSILIVTEIRSLKEDLFDKGMIVVVRKSANISNLGDLKGKNLCHPGIDSGFDWNYLYSQYFEERMAPSECEQDITVFEDRVKATSEFFGKACIAGPWSVNVSEDTRLKQKYSNLCALCDSLDCRSAEKYRGSGGAFTCFKDGVGDVLWVRKEDVKKYLRELSLSPGTASDFEFLCDDGSLMPINKEKPCVWLGKPWRVIAANKKSAPEVQKLIDNVNLDKNIDWSDNFIHVFELYFQSFINIMKTPEDYLKTIPGYLSASTMSESNCHPKHSIKLCVTSAIEKVKCVWTGKAASTLGIQPSLECIQKVNLTECFDSVAHSETDVVVVPPDFLYEAVTNFHLRSFLFETGNHPNGSYLASAVVNKHSSIWKLEDLKKKKACFTKRNGIGWKSAALILKQKTSEESECGTHEGLSSFFNEICVVNKGNQDNDLNICCPSVSVSNKDELNILHCLRESGCDVAFMDYNTLKENLDEIKLEPWAENLKLSDFRRICTSDSNNYCHWMWSFPNYLMYSSNVSSIKSEEALNLFYQIGQFFGVGTRKSSSMFKIFGSFSVAQNILFRDTSKVFVMSDNYNHSKYYKNMIDEQQLCSKSSFKFLNHFLLLFTVFVLSNNL